MLVIASFAHTIHRIDPFSRVPLQCILTGIGCKFSHRSSSCVVVGHLSYADLNPVRVGSRLGHLNDSPSHFGSRITIRDVLNGNRIWIFYLTRLPIVPICITFWYFFNWTSRSRGRLLLKWPALSCSFMAPLDEDRFKPEILWGITPHHSSQLNRWR